MNTVEQMKLFMEPKSVALVGITRATGFASWNAMEHLINYGYDGKIYPINPSADEILGLKCYPSIKDVPDEVELAVILTPNHLGPKLVKECVEKGIKAITVVGQGFADGDEIGKAMQEEIVRIAREGGARVLGPNTFGSANAFKKFNSAFTWMDMRRVNTGVICQTGMFLAGLPKFHIVGKGIDLGNTSDIDFSDGLEYFEDDPQVKLVLLYIEGIRDGARFVQTAKRVSKKKPIFALKAGQSEEAAKAIQSHSGNLMGSDEAYNAAFKQSGVMRVADAKEFEDMTKAFLRLPLMKGKGIGVISITGGGGILATDACTRHGLHLAQISPQSQARLTPLAPPWQRYGNPADFWPPSMIAGNPLWEVLYTTMETFLQDDNVHGIFLVMPESPKVYMDALKDSFILTKKYDKPAVLWCYGTKVEGTVRGVEKYGNIVYYPSMLQGANALARLNEYYEYLSREDR